MKTAVITGATGSIGRSLIDLCISRGYEVLAVVHRSSPRAEELKSIEHCHVLHLDLDEYDNAVEELSVQGFAIDDYSDPPSEDHSSDDHSADNSPCTCLSNFDLFFHLAWMAPFGPDRNNLDLQLKNIEYSLAAVRFASALGCSVFIGTGSQAEYGRVSVPLAPDTPAFPETGYGIAKLCAGQMTRLACARLSESKDNSRKAGIHTDETAAEPGDSRMKHIWCRILSVYGPYDNPKSIIRTALTDMLAGNETAFTPCEQMWDFMYADDAAAALFTTAVNGEDGKTYVVGSGNARPLRDHIKEIADITDYTRDIGYGKLPYNEKQVMFLQADISALKEIGFVPSYSFGAGIRKMISSI